jgi:hypothetical protein
MDGQVSLIFIRHSLGDGGTQILINHELSTCFDTVTLNCFSGAILYTVNL